MKKGILFIVMLICVHFANAYSIKVLSPSSGSTSVCFGSTVVLQFLTATGSATTAAWYTTQPTDANECSIQVAEYVSTFSVVVNGTVTIWAKPACGTSNTGSLVSITLTVGQYPNGKAILSGPTNLCYNSPNTTYNASNSGGSTNEWALSPASAGVITNNNGTCSVAWTPGFTGVAGLNCRHNQSICGYSSWSDTLKITINALPATPSIKASGATTICNGNTVPLSAPVGYSYLWSSGETTESIAAASVGNYTVTVVDNNGCKSASSSPVTIDSLPVTPSITTGGATTICQGNSVSLSAPTGYTYQWSTGATSQSITASLAGSYTVKITDANNCTSANSQPVAVAVNSLPPTPDISASGSTAICQGSSVSLSAPSGYTYKWSTGALSQSISVSTVGNYTVQVIGTNGCISVSSSPASVTINSLPATPSISIGGATIFCQGNSVILSAPSSTSYKWSNGTITQNATISSTGNYTLQVIDINGCTSANSQPVSVTVNSLPATPAITASGSTSICLGNSVSLSAPTGYTYLWSNGATTQNISTSLAGNYTVQVTDGNNCTSANSLPKAVIVNNLPATPTITASGSTTICDRDVVSLSAPTGYTYLWSNNSTGRSITTSLAGNYSVQVKDGNGCNSAFSSPVTITINNLPAKPTISTSGATTFCQGGSVSLTAPTSTSYLWSNGGSWVATSQNTTITSNGIYSIKIIDNNGCISDSSYVVVTVRSLPPIPSITSGSSTIICQGSTVSLSAPAGYSYLWSNGLTTQNIGASIEGNYTVKITDANNCTSANSQPVSVTVNSIPLTPDITAGGSTTFCKNGYVVLSAPAGYTYLWSNGLKTQSIYAGIAGNYTVQIKDGNGCLSANSHPITVKLYSLPATPSITVSGSTTICQGDSVLLSASSGYAYQWSTGATTQILSVKTSGYYQTQIIDSNGCKSDTSSSTIIKVNSMPATPIITAAGKTTICQGNVVWLSAPTGYKYHWSNGANAQSIAPWSTGNYTVKITDGNNCTSANSQPMIFTVNNLPPMPTITIGGSLSICKGSSVPLSAPTGYTYKWSTGATLQNITASLAGKYYVTIIDANGCVSSNDSSVTISVNSPVIPSITTSGTTSICQGNSITLSAPTGYAYQWSNGAMSQNISVSLAGNYNVRVKDVNGCNSDTSNSIKVIIKSIPSNAGTISGTSNVLQGQKAVTYTVPLITNATSYIWTIPTGTKGNSSTNSITVDFDSTAVSSNITVKGISSCGDGINSTLAITVNPIPFSAGVISGATSVVQGQTSVTYTVPIIANSTSYIWTLPNGFIGSSSTNSITVDISNSAQSGNISVKGHNSNGDGKISSLPLSVEIPIITPSVNSILVSATPSSSSSINIISNTTWITSSNQSWLTVSQSTSSGNGSITISATNNPTNVTRTATITIQTASSSQTITVTQGAGTGTAVEGVSNVNLRIYPNPAKDHITISFDNYASMSGYTVKIANSVGQTVYTSAINQQTSFIDLSSWSGIGVYIINIIDASSTVIESRKIVLE